MIHNALSPESSDCGNCGTHKLARTTTVPTFYGGKETPERGRHAKIVLAKRRAWIPNTIFLFAAKSVDMPKLQ